MQYNRFRHHRRSIRLKGWDYSKSGAYYVTICVKGMVCLFGRVKNNNMVLNELRMIAHRNWYKIPDKYSFVSLDEFQVMPNHLHGILIFKKKHGGKIRRV